MGSPVIDSGGIGIFDIDHFSEFSQPCGARISNSIFHLLSFTHWIKGDEAMKELLTGIAVLLCVAAQAGQKQNAQAESPLFDMQE
jgi:hypothetical protein